MARVRIASIRRPNHSDLHYTDQGSGKLLIIILSAFVILAAAKGVSHLTGLPYLFALILAAVMCVTKMYFLRYQPPQEIAMDNGWDRLVGYAVTSFFFIALAAFGLYGFAVAVGASSLGQKPVNDQLPVDSQSFRDSPTSGESKSANGEGSEVQIDDRTVLTKSIADKSSPTPLPKELNETPALTKRLEVDQPDDVNISKLTWPLKQSNRVDGLKAFVSGTLTQNTYALGCWLVPAILEAIILALVLHNRPRVYYY